MFGECGVCLGNENGECLEIKGEVVTVRSAAHIYMYFKKIHTLDEFNFIIEMCLYIFTTSVIFHCDLLLFEML